MVILLHMFYLTLLFFVELYLFKNKYIFIYIKYYIFVYIIHILLSILHFHSYKLNYKIVFYIKRNTNIKLFTHIQAYKNTTRKCILYTNSRI